MRKFLIVVGTLVALGIVAVAAIILVPTQRTPPQPARIAAATTGTSGEYAMRVADCAGCHTADGGQPFAGGRPIDSPLGTIWSSNITPDPEHGIGSWTLDDFRAALYDGIDDEGHHIYPAMPSANYRALSEEDVAALYGYFHDQVTPVASDPPETSLPFPFDQRWGLRVWSWIAYPKAGFVPPYDDAALDRGAYLVEGPGHCGACHTPRNAAFVQEAYGPTDAAFLSGGRLGAWDVPSLRGPASAPAKWSEEELAEWLLSGRNAHAGVAGEMALVVKESTQWLAGDDAAAIAHYLRHVARDGQTETAAATPAPPGPTETETLLRSASPDMALGARLYLDNCNACHFVDGKGANGVFPELVGNATVLAERPGGLLDVVLNGAQMPSTAARPLALRMPAFGTRLSDDEAAALLTFVRSGWGNAAGAVTAAEVETARTAAE